jgi:outer membrane protein, heavy metal efflux system
MPTSPRSLPWFRSCALCAVGLLWCSRVVSAQPAAPPLSLRGAVQIALDSSPGTRMIDGRTTIEQGRVRQEAQWTNPLIDFRRENLGSPLLPDIFTTLYLPLDPLRRRSAQGAAARAGVSRAQRDRDVARQQLAWETLTQWLRVMVADGAVTAARERRDALLALATFDSTRAVEGAVAEVVALRARLEADRARVAEAEAIARDAQERAALAALLGRPPSAIGRLDTLPAAELLPALPDTAVLLADAIATRADLAARREAIREAEARASAERRGIFPEWQLQGGTKQTSGFMTGQLGILVPLPLFHRNDAARERARGEVTLAAADRDQLVSRIRGELLAAVSGYEATRAAQRAAPQAFATRGAEIATIVRTAYREGAATLVELLDAERVDAESRLATIAWTVDVLRARLAVAYARGRLLEELP